MFSGAVHHPFVPMMSCSRSDIADASCQSRRRIRYGRDLRADLAAEHSR
jgi:hypothetical protein